MTDRTFKNKHGNRWTDPEIKTLMTMWHADAPVGEIAEKLETTEAAIQKVVVRLRQEGIPLKRRTKGHVAGRKNNPWSQSEIEYLLRRRRDRGTSEEIGQELGRTHSAINAMIQKLRKENVVVTTFGSGCRRKWNPVIAMAAIPDTCPQPQQAETPP